MHIGIDDTDSTRGGCTTYIAALLAAELEQLGAKFLDYPNLLRLNPNVPWKTRGNGALCLRVVFDAELEAQVKETAVHLVEEYSDLSCKGTDPAIVFLKAVQVPAELTAFAKRAETTIVTPKEALTLIQHFSAEALAYNTQQGLVGALAAIGETLTDDYTYELIAYRTSENVGTKRQVDTQSIVDMDKALQPQVYNNVDEETGRIIITPRGPDPILFGIRGETPEVVREAFGLVKPLEVVERWVIFRSNQGTDMHLQPVMRLSDLQSYTSVVTKGVVSQAPRLVPVRHTIFALKDASAEVDCAAYEPTGDLRKIALQLAVGDKVEVTGAVRCAKGKPLTLNLEKIHVLHLTQQTCTENPVCPVCGKRLKSMGKNQGLRCEKCKTRYPNLKKTELIQPRSLQAGLYAAASRSQRHLTKPLRRIGLEKHGTIPNAPTGQWHWERS